MGDYVELHCHSNFSLLDGAAHIEELVGQAARLDMDTLALTDHDAVYGAVRFVQNARACGIWPVLGAELTLASGRHVTVLVEDEAGWGNLCYLISRARSQAHKGQASLPPEELAEHTAGLIALSGCRRSETAAALLAGDWGGALAAGRRLLEWFGAGRFWIEMQRHLLPDEGRLIYGLHLLARRLGVGCVATNNVHYATRDGHRLQDVLVCIREHVRLAEAGTLLRPNSEFYLKPAARMAALFADYPDALDNTRRIAERCRFELRYGVQDLPVFPTPDGLDGAAYLRRLCEEAAVGCYGEVPSRAREQLDHELTIIEQAGLSNYFLIIWDIVRFARTNGILCQGRGSAANSLVAYLLGITPIDPLAHDLVFERFLSAERQSTPDIDIDFQADRREEVIQYVYRRYGPEHTAMACTVVTFRARSALRDVGKALGLSVETVDRGAAMLDEGETVGEPDGAAALLADLARQIDGYPRHLGIHNGGMVVMGAPLSRRVPAEPAAMPGRVVVQWDKDGLEEVGLVKVDLLGLRMLSAVAEAVEIIAATTEETIEPRRLSFDDPAVFEMIARADTIGVFQVESRAQAQVLPRLKPTCFNDLVVSISLIRPGPLQGNMVHPYLRRRAGQEPVTYPHPSLEAALRETLGVILFQEQVLKVARDLAGFTAGQGEQLRRALGSKRAEERIEQLRQAFLNGARSRGVPAEVAEATFEQLKAFGGYSFPKSHAAAFAVLVYQSAWLKRYYPAAFYAALLNNQPMGFWSPAVLVGDARRHGVEVLPVHIHRSQARCTVEGGRVRLGLEYVRGLGEASIARLLAAREAGAFCGLADLCRRTRLPRPPVENLIQAGALDGWGVSRRKLLWELGRLRYQADELDLILEEDEVDLPSTAAAEKLGSEYGVLGLSTGEHVMALYRPWLRQHGVSSSSELAGRPDGQKARVAGLVVVHQAPPTAKGHHFVTLEDEEGMVNVIVRPAVYVEYRRVWRSATLLVVEGRVQQRDGVVNLLAERARGMGMRPGLVQ